MSLLFAAIGATVAALVEVTLGPYLAVGHATTPHPVLVGGVIWTIAAGLEQGLAWAVAGGILLDALLGRPLGSSVFAMLVAVGGASVIARPLPRLRVLAPAVAIPVLSLVSSILIAILATTLEPGIETGDPLELFMPSAAYDAVLGLLLGPLAVSIHDRRAAADRVDW